MKRKRRLTRPEFQRVADLLRSAIDSLAEMDCILAGALTDGEVASCHRTFGRVQEMRSYLDNLAVTQHPDWPEAKCLFYGPSWTHNTTWRTGR